MSKNPDDPDDIELTEKSARDFKDGVESIETAGKMGTYTTIAALFTKLSDIANDPRLKVLMDFLDLWGKFLRELNAEEAGEIAEYLYAPENVRTLRDIAKAFKFVMEDTSNLQQSLLTLNVTLKLFDAEIQNVTTYFNTVYAEFALMPGKLVEMMKTGFRMVTSDLSDWFKNWLEDMIEEAMD